MTWIKITEKQCVCGGNLSYLGTKTEKDLDYLVTSNNNYPPKMNVDWFICVECGLLSLFSEKTYREISNLSRNK